MLKEITMTIRIKHPKPVIARAVARLIRPAQEWLVTKLAGRDIWVINADVHAGYDIGLTVNASGPVFHSINSVFEAGLIIRPCLYSGFNPVRTAEVSKDRHQLVAA
jgi:hypothetical protein